MLGWQVRDDEMTPMRHPLALAVLLLALPAMLAPQPAAAARHDQPLDPMAPGLSGAERLQALLERVKLQQKNAKTIEARFVQHRESSMLLAPEESTGTFSYAAPDRVRWEYQAPTPITVVIRGTEMTTWYRDLKRAEILKIGRYSNQIFKFLGASGRPGLSRGVLQDGEYDRRPTIRHP